MRSGGEIRANELQTTGRRRRRTGNRAVFIGMAVMFAVLLFYIRDMNARLKEVQEILEQIRPAQNGGMGTEGGSAGQSGGDFPVDGARQTDQTGKGAERADGNETVYERIGEEGTAKDAGRGAAGSSRPVQRTLAEALQRLEELGETDETIKSICEKSGEFHEKLLLALANNPEMADFVAGYPDSIYDDPFAEGHFTDDEKKKECPLLLQWDTRWGYQPYGDMNIGLSGCGPTCLSMVLFALTRDEALTPQKIALYAMDNGFYVEGTGTAWALMTAYPPQCGVNVREMHMEESALKTALDWDQILICAMGPGDFTTAGHFIVIYDYDEEGFYVNDPNSIVRSGQKWPYETLKGQIKNIWAFWE